MQQSAKNNPPLGSDLMLIMSASRIQFDGNDIASITAMPFKSASRLGTQGRDVMKYSAENSDLNPLIEAFAKQNQMPCFAYVEMLDKLSGGKPVRVLAGIKPADDSASDILPKLFMDLFTDLDNVRKNLGAKAAPAKPA